MGPGLANASRAAAAARRGVRAAARPLRGRPVTCRASSTAAARRASPRSPPSGELATLRAAGNRLFSNVCSAWRATALSARARGPRVRGRRGDAVVEVVYVDGQRGRRRRRAGRRRRRAGRRRVLGRRGRRGVRVAELEAALAAAHAARPSTETSGFDQRWTGTTATGSAARAARLTSSSAARNAARAPRRTRRPRVCVPRLLGRLGLVEPLPLPPRRAARRCRRRQPERMQQRASRRVPRRRRRGHARLRRRATRSAGTFATSREVEERLATRWFDSTRVRPARRGDRPRHPRGRAARACAGTSSLGRRCPPTRARRT